MNMMTIDEAERLAKNWTAWIKSNTIQLKSLTEVLESKSKDLELLKTQIASARIDGKKEFDADTYMKGKKK